MSAIPDWDIVVVGAGAAGLMAAIRAAEEGRRVLVLEKNRRPGVKILMSGGTRCNITHATDNRGIVEAYGPPGRFLHSALAAFSVQDTLDFFASEGVATKVEETGKIFPVSNKALDVLDALLRRLHRSGAVLALEEPLRDLQIRSPGFVVTTPQRAIHTGRVILTTGGQSYPGSGTTGDGYEIAARFGHTIVPPRPALVPITVKAAWVAELRGHHSARCRRRGVLEGDKAISVGRGSLLFAHFGLSGPGILDVSRVVSAHSQPQFAVPRTGLPSRTERIRHRRMAARRDGGGREEASWRPSSPRCCRARIGDVLVVQAGLPVEPQGRGTEQTGAATGSWRRSSKAAVADHRVRWGSAKRR